MVKTDYSAKDIQVLEGLAHVRQRPGMYIGGTGAKGLHHLVWEVLDNAVDEAANGFADKINVCINKDGSITIADNGRGIPVDIHPVKKVPAVRLVFEVLGAGGKFNSNNYKTSGGLHGVGASVVNALSKWVDIEVKKDGKLYTLKYENAKLSADLKVVKKVKESGTKITFMPDESIFESIEFKHEVIKNRLREMAFLNKGLTIEFSDEIREKEETFFYEGGLKEFVIYLNSGKDPITKDVIHIEGQREDVIVEFAMQHTTSYTENIYSFVNNINTIEGGTHDTGFRSALTRACNEYLRQINEQKQRNKKEYSLQGPDVTEGLTAILSVKMPNTQFEGQTKTKLGNPEIKGIVYNIVYEGLMQYFNNNTKNVRSLFDKIISAFESREAAKQARDLARKKNKLTSSSSVLSVSKLASCSSKNSNETEIIMVEGESAGGSAKQARNRRIQAILPLKGKPMNVEKKTLKEIIESEELQNIIKSIGTGIGEDFNKENLRYNKIIIATDADVDGAHIRIILLTFFFRYMKQLIEDGHIYIAQPPLYKVAKGKKLEYAYNDKQLEKAKTKIGTGYTIQRYKGLGEMNPEQLWDTTLNPDTRTLIKVTVEDAATADSLLGLLMGTKTEPRKEYIKLNM